MKIQILLILIISYNLYAMTEEIDPSVYVKKTVKVTQQVNWLNLYGKLLNGRYIKCTVATGRHTTHKSCISAQSQNLLDNVSRVQVQDEPNSYCHLMAHLFESQKVNKWNIAREAFRFIN